MGEGRGGWCLREGCVRFNSGVGEYTHTYEHARNPECPACQGKPLPIEVDGDLTLQEFIDETLKDDPRTYEMAARCEEEWARRCG